MKAKKEVETVLKIILKKTEEKCCQFVSLSSSRVFLNFQKAKHIASKISSTAQDRVGRLLPPNPAQLPRPPLRSSLVRRPLSASKSYHDLGSICHQYEQKCYRQPREAGGGGSGSTRRLLRRERQQEPLMDTLQSAMFRMSLSDLSQLEIRRHGYTGEYQQWINERNGSRAEPRTKKMRMIGHVS